MTSRSLHRSLAVAALAALMPLWTTPAADWAWPLPGRPEVTREFRAPAQRWSPGHRGVDLSAAPGQVVLAPADGVVAYAGVVVDRGELAIAHRGGVRTSYEPVTPLVEVGHPVRQGQPVATVAGTPGHCAPAGCLHWGARRGGVYTDPLTLVRPPEPPVLLPLARPWAPPGAIAGDRVAV
jgi:murein DD-endopeptidase MepM/ murein hydrolase activator NlpD